jgi:hypothetical protein
MPRLEYPSNYGESAATSFRAWNSLSQAQKSQDIRQKAQLQCLGAKGAIIAGSSELLE